MAQQTIEATGTDVETAIAEGLAELGVDRDAVEIEVLDEGSRGLIGIGAREARVRLTVKPELPPVIPAEPDFGELSRAEAPPTEEPTSMEKDEAEIAQGVLLELLGLMDIEGARVDVRRAEAAPGEKEPPLVFDVRGPGTDVLIGRRGETLSALQHVTRLIVGQEMTKRVNLVVDVEGFKARRETSLSRMAHRLAEQAVRTNRTVVLEPMPPHERRIIHLALRDHPHVTTESIGEGTRRKVTIIPR
jgi:spoIIIJ-associated protein